MKHPNLFPVNALVISISLILSFYTIKAIPSNSINDKNVYRPSKQTMFRSQSSMKGLFKREREQYQQQSNMLPYKDVGQLQNLVLRENSYTEPEESAKTGGPPLPNGVEPSAGCTEKCQSSLTFQSEEAKKYHVGTQIPGLPFRTKNSWAGNIPIEAKTVENASLYFWLWGKDAIDPGNDLVIWLTGGPGCSSLISMTEETGPWLYQSVKEKPYPNDFSFTKAANILYVEQPVHTGFSQGTTLNTNETEVAEQFASFLEKFYEIFPELEKMNLWFVGESYGGVYVPYITNHLFEQGKTPQLQGSWIIDGVLTRAQLIQDTTALQFAQQHQEMMNFTDHDLELIKNEGKPCGLDTYIDENLYYPPKGPLPKFSGDCHPFYLMKELAQDRNIDYNVYDIGVPYSSQFDPLGEINTGSAQYHHTTFFDDPKLQSYINAPHQKWIECSQVFIYLDSSLAPDEYPNRNKSVLANVIEKSKRFIIMNGNYDSLIITNGTALALQNLLWNDKRGFSTAPNQPLYDTHGHQRGVFVEERGLLFAQIEKAGHMIPTNEPSTALATLMHLLGQRNFTQPG